MDTFLHSNFMSDAKFLAISIEGQFSLFSTFFLPLHSVEYSNILAHFIVKSRDLSQYYIEFVSDNENGQHTANR